jgi:putative PIN family toxin of toxin-antitoxin system
MRLVIDTNVVASGLLWDGTPARIIDAAQAGVIEIYTSRVLLTELTRILKREKFAKAVAASGLDIEGLVLGYAELASIVEPLPISPTIIADPDDDHVLACALAAQAELIVSGDKHLLDLEVFQNIEINTAAKSMERIRSLLI